MKSTGNQSSPHETAPVRAVPIESVGRCQPKPVRRSSSRQNAKAGLPTCFTTCVRSRKPTALNSENRSYRLYSDFPVINCSKVMLAPRLYCRIQVVHSQCSKAAEVWTMACLTNPRALRNDTDRFSRPMRDQSGLRVELYVRKNARDQGTIKQTESSSWQQ